MGIKRIVDTTFWTDPDVIDLYSCEDKYFLLYLLTNPHTKQCGIYSLPKKYMAFETGYSKECIEVLIDRFSKKYQKIIYNNGTQEIAVLNSLKYSVVKGGKPVEDCIKKDLSVVKDNLLIQKTYNHLLDFWNSSKRPFDQNIKLIFEEAIKKESTKERTNDNDNDNDNDNEESYHDSYHDSFVKDGDQVAKPPSKDKKTKDNTFKNKIEEYTDNENLRNTLTEFVSMRKTMKPGITDYALKLILVKLDRLSNGLDDLKIKILEQSIIGSYKGVFPIKEAESNGKSNATRNTETPIPDKYKNFYQ